MLVLLLFSFGGLTEYLVLQQRQRQQHQQMQQVVATAGQLRAMLESELNAPLSLSAGVAAFIQASQGQVSAESFQLLLSNLVQQGRHLRNIGVAPDNRLTYIYPLRNNEKVLGLYYPDLAEQWPEIVEIIQTRQAKLVGPVQLAQGGTGFIHRIPVYLADDRYWGIVSTVLDIDSVWRLLMQQTQEHEVSVALRLGGDGLPFVALLGDLQLFSADAIVLDLTVAGSRWQLAVQPNTLPNWQQAWPVRLTGWLISLMLWLLMLMIFIANRRWADTAAAWQRSEAYFRTILDNVADAIVVVDRHGRIEKVNQAALRLLGYPAGQLTGQSYQRLFIQPPVLQTSLQQSSLQQPSLNQPVASHGEYQVRHQSGQAILVELDQTRIDQQQQGLTVLLMRDITERKRIELLKDEFVSTVSHELRTPLTAINGALGLLAGGVMGEMPQAQQQLLTIAKQNGQQLAVLINDILDIEKLAAGKMQLYLQPLSIMGLLQVALQRNLPLAQQAAVQLKIQADLLDEVQVLVDESRLQQVFANLLANAVRFSPSHGTVLVEVRLIGVRVRLSVSDQGPGVPVDFVPRLFQKFSQADSSSTRQLGGTGLGLAICKELIERMGGQIGYQPTPQGGACFYFDLPVHTGFN